MIKKWIKKLFKIPDLNIIIANKSMIVNNREDGLRYIHIILPTKEQLKRLDEIGVNFKEVLFPAISKQIDELIKNGQD